MKVGIGVHLVAVASVIGRPAFRAHYPIEVFSFVDNNRVCAGTGTASKVEYGHKFMLSDKLT